MKKKSKQPRKKAITIKFQLQFIIIILNNFSTKAK